jgi:hypothetical protein
MIAGKGGAPQRLSGLLLESLDAADRTLAGLLDSPLGDAADPEASEGLLHRLALDVADINLILIAPAAIRTQDALRELLAVSVTEAGREAPT